MATNLLVCSIAILSQAIKDVIRELRQQSHDTDTIGVNYFQSMSAVGALFEARGLFNQY